MLVTFRKLGVVFFKAPSASFWTSDHGSFFYSITYKNHQWTTSVEDPSEPNFTNASSKSLQGIAVMLSNSETVGKLPGLPLFLQSETGFCIVYFLLFWFCLKLTGFNSVHQILLTEISDHRVLANLNKISSVWWAKSIFFSLKTKFRRLINIED